MQKRIFELFVFIVLLLQVCNLIICGNLKEGYHGDELYSYQFISVIGFPSINSDRKDFAYLNTWHTPDYFNDYYTITSEESFDIIGVYNNILHDVHPPIFYILLHLTCSLFSQNQFTKWTGIGLNIFFFVFTFILLYLLSKKILKSKWWALFVCILYGFSVVAVSTVVFIRMYMILTFISLAFIYVHIVLYEKLCEQTSFKHRLVLYFSLIISFVFGLLTHYYFLIFAFFCCFFFSLYLLKNKKFVLFFEYAFSMLLSLLTSYLLWDNITSDIFDSYREKEAILNFSSFATISESFSSFIKIIDNTLFSGFGNILLVWILVLTLIIIFKYLLKNNFKFNKFSNKIDIKNFSDSNNIKIVIYILFVLVLYILIISKVVPYKTERYIFNIFPLIILLLIYMYKELLTYAKSKVLNILTIVLLVFITCLGYNTIGIDYLYKEDQKIYL